MVHTNQAEEALPDHSLEDDGGEAWHAPEKAFKTSQPKRAASDTQESCLWVLAESEGDVAEASAQEDSDH